MLVAAGSHLGLLAGRDLAAGLTEAGRQETGRSPPGSCRSAAWRPRSLLRQGSGEGSRVGVGAAYDHDDALALGRPVGAGGEGGEGGGATVLDG